MIHLIRNFTFSFRLINIWKNKLNKMINLKCYRKYEVILLDPWILYQQTTKNDGNGPLRTKPSLLLQAMRQNPEVIVDRLFDTSNDKLRPSPTLSLLSAPRHKAIKLRVLWQQPVQPFAARPGSQQKVAKTQYTVSKHRISHLLKANILPHRHFALRQHQCTLKKDTHQEG